jgi:hypothetical protein
MFTNEMEVTPSRLPKTLCRRRLELNSRSPTPLRGNQSLEPNCSVQVVLQRDLRVDNRIRQQPPICGAPFTPCVRGFSITP